MISRHFQRLHRTGKASPLRLALLSLLLPGLLGCPDPTSQERAKNGTPIYYSVEEKSISTLQADLAAGTVTSAQLVEQYLIRIATQDRSGAELNSIITLNPDAIAVAMALDQERKQKGPRSALHGIPILLKDNIESADAMATTAGSLALQDNLTKRDATLVKRLRDAGAIILGKTNLSEWANMRSTVSVSGWSSVGGLTRNPYAIDRNACGSSSGSAVATAASFAAASVGTETDGSITCPAAMTGVVGLKPTVGLISRRHIIPLAESQDSAGPMARTVTDAALLLEILAGSDPDDPATRDADRYKQPYSTLLKPHALQGKRLGVLRSAMGYHHRLDAVFEQQLTLLREAGAELVEITDQPDLKQLAEQELDVLLTEFKRDLDRYLADSPAAIPVRSLAELIAFNDENADDVLRYFGQDLFEQAEQRASNDRYQRARDDNRRQARKLLDDWLQRHQLAALIAPTTGPAWSTDLVNGDHYLGAVSTLPAIAGYPHLTVPMGQVHGLPVGLSWIGPAWSEATLLAMAFDFEQRANARQAPAYLSFEELLTLQDADTISADEVAADTESLPE